MQILGNRLISRYLTVDESLNLLMNFIDEIGYRMESIDTIRPLLNELRMKPNNYFSIMPMDMINIIVEYILYENRLALFRDADEINEYIKDRQKYAILFVNYYGDECKYKYIIEKIDKRLIFEKQRYYYWQSRSSEIYNKNDRIYLNIHGYDEYYTTRIYIIPVYKK